MRQAIGTTWVMQLVIIFMLIFVAFLALTINYTKAFKVKNELVSLIERNEGIQESNDGSIHLINNYLEYNNYTTRGSCAEGEYGVSNLHDNVITAAVPGEKYHYCVQKINTSTPTTPRRAKYKIRIFFQFSLPVVGDLFTFSVEGTTIDITHTPENDLP